jgi:tetratricopeptide (TPR) repeat protein
MPKRISSIQGWLKSALELARKRKFNEAQQVLRKLAGRNFQASDLRMAAIVNARCDNLDRAESCWLEIERRDKMKPGDYYMLGCLQARMSKHELAVQCFEREITISTNMKTDYFLDSNAIQLASLMVKFGRPSRAKEILASVKDNVADHVEGVGVRTRAAIMQEIERNSGSAW